MTFLTTAALRFALLGRNLTSKSPYHCLTTVLFHNFMFEGEHLEQCRERLKRQCEWLKRNYNAITLSDATEALHNRLTTPLLITLDDACIDIFDVFDIFKSLELPIVIFVCAGWSANASSLDDDTALAGLLSDLEWY